MRMVNREIRRGSGAWAARQGRSAEDCGMRLGQVWAGGGQKATEGGQGNGARERWKHRRSDGDGTSANVGEEDEV